VETKLNSRLLPLQGWEFFPDVEVRLEVDPMLSALESQLERRVTQYLERSPVLHDYVVSGVYPAGERNGDVTPNDLHELTAEETERLKKLIAQALDEIKKRGLIEKIVPNPDGIDLEKLKKYIHNGEIEIDPTGKDTDGDEGKTIPYGPPDPPGSDKFPSHVILNGPLALLIGNISGEEFIALVLHELAHALLNATNFKVGTIIDIAIRNMRGELYAFAAVWDAIARDDTGGGISLIAEDRCQEIREAIAQLVATWERFAADVRLTRETNVDPPTVAQQAMIKQVRAEIGTLLKKYKDAIVKNNLKCVYKHRQSEDDKKSGTPPKEEATVDVIDRLLDIFK
jgi:hypothetical protein